MAPSAPKKATPAKSSAARNDRRSMSRHSTPLTDADTPPPPTSDTSATASVPPMRETPYLHTPTAALISFDPSIETLIERSNAPGSKNGDPPSARDLHAIHDKIRDHVNRFMTKRGDVCNHGMRQLVQRRKEREAMEREQEAARAEEERVRVKREETEKRKEKKALGKKRSHDEMELDSEEKERKEAKEALPSVGAHGLARQDGVGVHEGVVAPPSPPVPPGAVIPELMDTADSPTGSEDTRHDPPPTAPLYERIFGKDPTQTDDPIIYDIRDLREDMTDNEKQAILNVAQWPESDLHDLTAGDPPDMDFTNAKPANQVNFSTFQGYIDPYIRPYTEEDVAFLKERGDRFTPYVVPQRGAKGFKEVWAAEDGETGIQPPQRHVSNPNEARGSMEDLDDEIADSDTVSMGPSMSRMLSLLRSQPNGVKKEDKEDESGDVSMANGDAENSTDLLPNGTAEDFKPVTFLSPEMRGPPSLPQLDYETFEQRALQELKHIGFIAPDDRTEYDQHNDDEVSARLRTLQHELRRVARQNNVRKARVLELAEERMAMQEYSNIADDLDNQVNAAYLKRNRSLAKPSHKKGSSQAARPGQKGVAMGVGGGRGVSDGVRALMQKRRDWIDMVGPVVAYGRPPIPTDGETIFDEASLKRLEKVEQEAELADVEGE